MSALKKPGDGLVRDGRGGVFAWGRTCGMWDWGGRKKWDGMGWDISGQRR